MKKIIIASLLLSTALSSCSSDFLNQEPPLYVTDSDVFTSPERIESALLGLYGNFKNTASYSFMGGKTYLAFDNRGDDFVNLSQNLVVLYDTYNMRVGSTYAENTTTWEQAYATINKCNGFMQNLEGAMTIVGNKYEQYKSEALFIRAMSYYYLVSLYGMPYKTNSADKAIPLRLKFENDGHNNAMTRSTVAEVYTQILTDLEASSALPTTNNSYTAVTRATQAAAEMLKMRVYMAMENWNNALISGNAINGYSLTSDVKDPFSAPYYTQENIFSLPMAQTNRPNTQQSLAEYYFNGEIMAIDTENGIMSKTNYSLPDDSRISTFVGSNNIYRKYTDQVAKLDWVPIFRYAETLLNIAECQFNLGNEIAAKKALTTIRRRAIAAEDDLLDIDALTGDELKTAIYNERRLELMGEGIRGIDIHRRAENFVKGSSINVAPSSGTDGYIWPIPQTEVNLNPDVTK